MLKLSRPLFRPAFNYHFLIAECARCCAAPGEPASHISTLVGVNQTNSYVQITNMHQSLNRTKNLYAGYLNSRLYISQDNWEQGVFVFVTRNFGIAAVYKDISSFLAGRFFTTGFPLNAFLNSCNTHMMM